jgi:hypothetical protein
VAPPRPCTGALHPENTEETEASCPTGAMIMPCPARLPELGRLGAFLIARLRPARTGGRRILSATRHPASRWTRRARNDMLPSRACGHTLAHRCGRGHSWRDTVFMV